MDEHSSTESPTVDVLRKARALIEEKGWVQGIAKSDFGFCPVGAISATTSGSGVARSAICAMRAAVGTAVLMNWNDDPFRTKEEVLAAFDKAIEVAS